MSRNGACVWLFVVVAAQVVPNVAVAVVEGYDYLAVSGGSAVATNGKWEDSSKWQELQGGDTARKVQRSDPSWDPNYWLGNSVPTTEDPCQPVFIRNGSTVTHDAISGTNVVRSVAIGGWEYTPGGTGLYPWTNAGGKLVVNGGSLKVGPVTKKELKVGNWYDGTLIQNGGYVEAYSMFMGDNAGLYVDAGDPNGTFRSPTGSYVMNGGLLEITGQYVRFGYRGGIGSMTLNSGAYMRLSGTLDPNGSGAHLDLGLGRIHNYTTGGTVASTGVLNINGGTLEMSGGSTQNRSLGIGAAVGASTRDGGIGVVNMTSGLIRLGGTASDVSAGRRGGLHSLTAEPLPESRASGALNMSGGSIACRDIKFGGEYGTGILNIQGGTISLTGGGMLGEASIVSMLYRAGNTADGTLNMSGGVIALQGSSTGTTLYVGRGSYSAYISTYLPEARATGTGVINLSGGSIGLQSITLGYGDGSQSVGKLSATGGKLTTTGALTLAAGDSTSAFMTVSKNATVQVGSLSMYDSPTTSRTSKLTVDVEKNGVGGKIAVAGAALLDGTLRMNVLARPKEGDVLNVVTSGGGITDSGVVLEFDALTGPKLSDPNDPNSALPFFAGAIDGTGNIYKVTFQGLTEGDANGDGKVDGGDLALMGGAWMQSGKSWGAGNFNNDPNGMVDGGDLALMGGMWMWSKPGPAPSGQPIPEPATASLLALAGLALMRRKRAAA